ncbi:MAG: nucleotide sugar dehydrogenase [Dehalococcoidia bacterium]|nr:nucleotide sugar dehydrogenase [Dehalococcoidia bacterium]
MNTATRTATRNRVSLRVAPTPLQALADRIANRTATVGVIGQGYVGFPLAQRAAERGFPTLGIEVDPAAARRCEQLNIHENYRVTLDANELGACEVVIIAVPTPTRESAGTRSPDLEPVRRAVAMLAGAPRSTEACLVVVESTYGPGTTRSLVAPALAPLGRLGEDLALGYSPERIDPGNDTYHVANIPKVVSGYDDQSRELVQAFYDAIVAATVPASCMEAAESCKLLENVFRFINITFAQEFEQFCAGAGVDAAEVTRLAATKPFGFMPFFAGVGIGGHCIAEDPYFLQDALRAHGSPSPLLDAAITNHEGRAMVIAGRVLDQFDRARPGGRVLLLGVTYKPNVADARRSPAEPLIAHLQDAGLEVAYHDPLVPRFGGLESVPIDCDPAGFDLTVLVTRHTAFDLGALAAAGHRLFDPTSRVAAAAAR